MSRWKPLRGRGGSVVQSGLDPHHPAAPKPFLPQYAAPRRAIVQTTYVTDDDDNRSRVAVECDVVLVRGSVPLPRVPVAQPNHGATNAHGLWVPQGCTRNIATGDAVSFRQNGAPASLYDDLDGDHVLVEFIDGDPQQPLITRSLSHTRSTRLVTGAESDADASLGWKPGEDRRGSPRRNEFYFAHYGTEMRVNAQGDFILDASRAFSDPSTEDDSGAIGQIRFRVKENRFLVVEIEGNDVFKVWKDGGQVKIDLGQNADQRVPLGDDLVQAIKDALDAVLDFANALATATPAPPNSALTVASVLAAYETPLVGLRDKILDAQAALDEALSSVARVKKT